MIYADPTKSSKDTTYQLRIPLVCLKRDASSRVWSPSGRTMWWNIPLLMVAQCSGLVPPLIPQTPQDFLISKTGIGWFLSSIRHSLRFESTERMNVFLVCIPRSLDTTVASLLEGVMTVEGIIKYNKNTPYIENLLHSRYQILGTINSFQ